MVIQRNRVESKNEKLIHRIILPIGIPAVFLLIWQWAVTQGYVNKVILPAPTTLWTIFISVLKSGKLWINLEVSFVRVFVGLFIGGIIGLIAGFLLGLIKSLNSAFSLLFSILRPIPTIAIVPIFILMFGIEEKSKYAVIAVAAFWPMLVNTLTGIVNVDDKLLELSYAYRIKNSKTVFKLVLPAAVPLILTGIRLAVSSAWMSVIAAEMISSSRGIGYLITISKEMARVGDMYVYVLSIGLVGFVVDKFLLWLEKLYLKKTRGYQN